MQTAVEKEITRRFRPALDRLGYLHDRWQDEKMYEDWSDYVTAMKTLPLPDGCEFLKASQKPFAVTATMGTGKIRLFVSNTKAGWTILK